ncbi:MAG TPA: L,D-transpeptidase [Thermoanaerobaculia bacterium]|nr:L,D-transpeptidase [Thermoanaerobaculia bacterium]
MEIAKPPDPPPPGQPRREPSGILAVRTRFMRKRAGRKLPRPSSGTLLVLFLLLLVGGIAAAVHRRVLESEFESRVARSQATPYEIKQIRHELADLELNEKELANALDTRLKYLQATKRNEFYISIDTKKKDFSFHFADKILRNSPVEIGPARKIVAGKKTWTFAPLTGAFSAENKFEGNAWRVPEWVYRMNGAKPPKSLPTVENGLGKYVIALGNDYVIHSPPSPESPLKGAKPGSFMVQEADLAAIWKRVGPETRVYIY